MSIWDARRESMALLEGPLSTDALLLDGTLSRLEKVVEACHKEDGSPRVRLAGVLATKAHRLGVGTYSMALDCVGQEAGALMRLLQEIYEMLTYMLEDASRVDEILEKGFPKAGVVGKAIGGALKPLRDHLNVHASHIAFTPDALEHIFDEQTGRLRLSRSPGTGAVLQTNILTLNAVLTLIVHEALEIVLEEHPGFVDDLLEEHERASNALSVRAKEIGANEPSPKQVDR